MGVVGLVLPHDGHHVGLVLGILYSGLGRLVVLGSGRKCVSHALAGGHRTFALGIGCGTSPRVGGLDDLAGHSHFLS